MLSPYKRVDPTEHFKEAVFAAVFHARACENAFAKACGCFVFRVLQTLKNNGVNCSSLGWLVGWRKSFRPCSPLGWLQNGLGWIWILLQVYAHTSCLGNGESPWMVTTCLWFTSASLWKNRAEVVVRFDI